MKKYIIPLFLIIITVVFILGFIEIDNSDKEKNVDGIIYGVTSINANLEKVTELSKRDEDIICATSRGLIEKDSEGAIIPSLAKEINVKDEGIEYEFILNDEIYWSDGTKITPEDIRDFFKELIKVEDEENIQGLLEVYGAKAFKDGTGSFDNGVAITTGDNYIKIRLNKKRDSFLEELTRPQYRVRKLLPLWGDIASTYGKLTYSGDYSIELIDDNGITLTKNTHGEGPNTISMVKGENEELAMASFEIGKMDIVLNPPKSQLEKLASENRLITLPSQDTYFLSLNNGENGLPLSVRRELYRNIYIATEEFMDGNPQRIESAEGSYFREDKEDLSKLQTRKVSINQDGQQEMKKIITLLAEDNDDSRDLCKFLVEWFRKNLSINLRYSLVKSEDINDIDLAKRYDLILFNKMVDSNDKKDFYNSISGLLNESEKKILESESKENTSNYSKIEEKLFNDCTLVPVMFANRNIAISEKVSDVVIDGNGNVDFSKIKDKK